MSSNFYVYASYKMFGSKKQDANGMYVVTPKGVVLFDSPWDDFPYQTLLDSIESRHHTKVILALATHSHEDRTSGLEFYKQKGIKTYTTKQTDAISIENERPRAEFLIEKDTLFNVVVLSLKPFMPVKGILKIIL